MPYEIYFGTHRSAIVANASLENETAVSDTPLSEPVLHGGFQRARYCVSLGCGRVLMP